MPLQGYQGQAFVSRRKLARVLRVDEDKLGALLVHVVYGYMSTTQMFYIRVVETGLECLYAYKPHFFEDVKSLDIIDAGLNPYK